MRSIILVAIGLLCALAEPVLADGLTVVSPWAINLGGTAPLLYVPDSNNNVIDVFPAGVRAPKLREKIAEEVPSAICVDAHGNMYVIDGITLVIAEFARGSKSPLRTIASPTGFFLPTSLAVASDGSIYILEENSQNASGVVNQINSMGKLLRSIPLGNQGYGGLTLDRAGILYVSAGHSVLRFAPGATKPNLILPQGSIAGGLAIDSANQLLVGLPGANRVAIEALPSGKVLRSILTAGAGSYITLDETSGYLYAVDDYGSTLQWYRYRNGHPLGFMSGPFTQVAVDAGK